MRPETMVKVTLQQAGTTADALGQPIDGWTDVATVGADIRHLSGIEAVKAGAATSKVTASARIRFRDDVVAGMRLLYGATAYRITAVLPDLQKRQYVDLVCEVVE